MKYLCPSFLLLLPRNCLFLTSSFGSFIFTLQFWFVTVSQKPFLTISVLCLDTQSCLTLCDPRDHRLPGSSVHGDSPHKNTGVGCHDPRIEPTSPALADGFFITESPGKPLPSPISRTVFISYPSCFAFTFPLFPGSLNFLGVT